MSDEKQSDQTNFQDTVTNEIELQQSRDEYHDWLDEDWKRQRDNLAPEQAPQLTPSFAIGDPREVQRQYNERKRDYYQKQKQIDDAFDDLTMDVRENGTTLSDEFESESNEVEKRSESRAQEDRYVTREFNDKHSQENDYSRSR